MNSRNRPGTVTLLVETPQGRFAARYSSIGLCGLEFPNGQRVLQSSESVPRTIQAWHAITSRAVKSALKGKQPTELPPLDLEQGTNFQRKVWEELTRIPLGATKSYADVALALRAKGAARAVGGACGANPLPLLIPCHRVLAANRRIGGFSGGLDWKRHLLKIEGVQLAG